MTLLGQLDRLESAGLVIPARMSPEMEYLFRHALVQEATYHTLVKQDRRRLHLAVGESLERAYPERLDELAPLLAHHFYEAGASPRALSYFTRAGDMAAAKYANAEAVLHYSRALDIARQNLEGQPTPTVQSLFARLGRALELQGRYDRALANYETMLGEARQRDDRALELAALVMLAQTRSTPNPHFDADKGDALSAEALGLARELGDSQAEAKMLWNQMNLMMLTGHLAEGICYGEQALKLAHELGLREQLAYILNDLWRAYLANGQWERALDSVKEASLLWREAHNLPMLTDSLSTMAQLYFFGGQYEQALRVAEEALQLSQSIRNIWGESYSQFFVGNIFWDRGEPDRAIAVMESCVRLSEEAGFTAPQIYTRANLALVYGSLGAVQHGIELAHLAMQLAEAHMPALRPQPLATLAWLHLLNGNGAEAETMLRAAYSDFTTNNPLVTAQVLQADVALALAQHDYTRALRAADDLIAYLTRTQMRYISVDALYLKGRALLEDRRIDEASAILAEARVLAEDIGSRRMLWQSLMGLSEIERHRGQPDQAQSYRQQAREIVIYIADHARPDLRESFLNLPDVRAALQAA